MYTYIVGIYVNVDNESRKKVDHDRKNPYQKLSWAFQTHTCLSIEISFLHNMSYFVMGIIKYSAIINWLLYITVLYVAIQIKNVLWQTFLKIVTLPRSFQLFLAIINLGSFSIMTNLVVFQ